jgi:hypothetical protein
VFLGELAGINVKIGYLEADKKKIISKVCDGNYFAVWMNWTSHVCLEIQHVAAIC